MRVSAASVSNSHMHSQQTLFGVALLLLLTRLSAAATLDSNTIISAENSFPGELVQIVSGASPPTVVQLIAGGEAEQLLVNDDSVLNMTGGSVTGAIYARHSSRVSIFGGNLGELDVRFDSVVNLFDGYVGEGVSVSGVQGTPTLNIFGGIVAGDVAVGGFTSLNMHGGRVGRVSGDVNPGRDYLVNVTGGSFSYFSFRGSATVHWSGGESRQNQLFIYDESVLHIYGSDWKLEYEDHYSGALLDGTQLTNFWFDLNGNGRVVLHSVPEPSALALACAAALPLALLMIWRSCCAASSQFAPASFSR